MRATTVTTTWSRFPWARSPRNVAISPDGRFVYVSNTVSGTVSVIRNVRRHPRVVRTVRVGTEPYGMAFTPSGTKLYVANARSNDVSVLNLSEHGRWGDRRDDDDDGENGEVARPSRVWGSSRAASRSPTTATAAMATEKVYVTQFLAVDRPGVTIGADDYKEGRVTVISGRERQGDRRSGAEPDDRDRVPLERLRTSAHRSHHASNVHRDDRGVPQPVQQRGDQGLPRLSAQHGCIARRPACASTSTCSRFCR